MNIQKLRQAIEIAKLLEDDQDKAASSYRPSEPGEFAIVVLDRGFVYVGDVEETDTYVIMKGAANIRYWGTKDGLGQLVITGPTADTKLDVCGFVRIPARAVISIHPTNSELWKARLSR